MKKNLTRKLALSAVTMGVAALTVTSTTYAWYTTNWQATASGMKASTAAANSNLLIATKTSENEEATTIGEAVWGKSVSFVDKSSIELTPAQWVKNDGASTESWIGLDKKDATVVNYTVWFSATSLTKSSYSLKMKLSDVKFSGGNANNDTSRNKQIFEVDAKSGTDKGNYTKGHSGNFGLIDVLGMRTEKIEEYSRTESNGKTTYTSKTSGIVTSDTKNYRYLAENNSGADAVTYYNNVYGLTDDKGLNRNTNQILYEGNLYAAKSDSVSTLEYKEYEIATITGDENNTRANEAYEAYFGIKFTLFIDGWDYQCFNAVAGTKLESMTLNFSLTAKTN